MVSLKLNRTDAAYDKIVKKIVMPDDFYLNVLLNIGVFSDPKRIIDIGCGNGYLLERIAKLNPQARLFGLDFSEKLLENAQKRLGEKVTLIKANALNLPFTDNQFGIVIMSEIIEHLENPTRGLTEARRVLKKDGLLILTFPNISSYFPFYPLIKKFPKGKFRSIFIPYEDPEKTTQPIDNCYLYEKIIDFLKETKFKIVKVSGTIFFPFVGEIPILSSLIIFLWRKTPFDKILNKLIGPKLAYRVLIKAIPLK